MCVISSQMAVWVSQVSLPQRPSASLISATPFTTLTQTGFSALPCTTTASNPAAFIMPPTRPPMLDREYHSGFE